MPKVSSLGHVGILVHDVERSKAFYRDLLGLTVSDESETGTVFMTAKGRSEEHHELLLRPGREDGKVVQQISFKCASLPELKEFHQLFLRHNVPIVRVASHGNAIGVYVRDPDDNVVEVYWQTGIDWPQPFGKDIDLAAPDQTIMQNLT